MRIVDLAAAITGLILLSPLLLIISLLVKLDSPGPIFYRSLRVGRYEQPFRLFKFRTMVVGAERRGPSITTAGDSRITTVGKSLRRTKADELPQLINVLKGEMSLVGPRPEDPRYVAKYTPEQRRVLSLRPGITSAASLRYRREEQLLAGPDWEQCYIEQIMTDKLSVELEYMDRRNFWTDLRLILLTFAVLVHDFSSGGSRYPSA
jgi:lipopolysaccharide/colanic/teichoic acid biosynthesis glycosyltransferase